MKFKVSEAWWNRQLCVCYVYVCVCVCGVCMCVCACVRVCKQKKWTEGDLQVKKISAK